MTHKAPLKDSVDFSETAEAVGQAEEGLVWAGGPLVLASLTPSWILGPLLPSAQPSGEAWVGGRRVALWGRRCTPFSLSCMFPQPAQHTGWGDTAERKH